MKRRATLSLLVPTHREDRPLERCLRSVAPQLKRGDEVIVIGDTHDGPLPMVEALVGRFGSQFRYLAHDAGLHDYGHSQLNAGFAEARGDYLHCNDDDDVWADDALATFRLLAGSVSKPTPFLFRFRSYLGRTFWAERGLFARNWIGGHCLLAPNNPKKLGKFTAAYNGDFDYVSDTVAHYGGPEYAVWRDELVAIARPGR